MAQFRKVPPESFGVMRERQHLPSIHFNQKQLPEIKHWQVGKDYEVALKIRQTSMREDEDKQISGSFDIVGVRVLDVDNKKRLRKASDKEIDEEMKKEGLS